MRIGVPPNSVNCFEGCAFFDLVSMALGTGAIRVPSPAAGMMTTTFMAGGQYTSAHAGVQMRSPKVQGVNHRGHEGSRRIFIPKGFLRVTSCPSWLMLLTKKASRCACRPSDVGRSPDLPGNEHRPPDRPRQRRRWRVLREQLIPAQR